MSNLLETMLARISGWLEALGIAYELWAFPLFVSSLYAIAKVGILLAWWIYEDVIAPLIRGLVLVSESILITLEFLASRLYRAFGASPPSLCYIAGDAIAANGPIWRLRVRRPARKVILVAIILLLSWWNGSYCDQRPDATACVAPPSDWARSFQDWWTSVKGPLEPTP